MPVNDMSGRYGFLILRRMDFSLSLFPLEAVESGLHELRSQWEELPRQKTSVHRDFLIDFSKPLNKLPISVEKVAPSFATHLENALHFRGTNHSESCRLYRNAFTRPLKKKEKGT